MTSFASKFKYDKKLCSSDLRETEIHLTEPGGKINGAFYRDCLLSEKLLPDIRGIFGLLHIPTRWRFSSLSS